MNEITETAAGAANAVDAVANTPAALLTRLRKLRDAFSGRKTNPPNLPMLRNPAQARQSRAHRGGLAQTAAENGGSSRAAQTRGASVEPLPGLRAELQIGASCPGCREV